MFFRNSDWNMNVCARLSTGRRKWWSFAQVYSVLDWFSCLSTTLWMHLVHPSTSTIDYQHTSQRLLFVGTAGSSLELGQCWPQPVLSSSFVSLVLNSIIVKNLRVCFTNAVCLIDAASYFWYCCVEENHSVGTINNVETSYFTQLKICYT